MRPLWRSGSIYMQPALMWQIMATGCSISQVWQGFLAWNGPVVVLWSGAVLLCIAQLAGLHGRKKSQLNHPFFGFKLSE